MKTPKKIKKPEVNDLDVENNNLGRPEPKSTKNLIEDEEFDDELDDLGDFDTLSTFDDDDDDEY